MEARYDRQKTWKERDDDFRNLLRALNWHLPVGFGRPKVVARLANRLECEPWDPLGGGWFRDEVQFIRYLAAKAVLEATEVDVGEVENRVPPHGDRWEAVIELALEKEYPRKYRAVACLLEPDGDDWEVASCAQEGETGQLACDVSWVSGKEAEEHGLPHCSDLSVRPPRRTVFEGFEVEL